MSASLVPPPAAAEVVEDNTTKSGTKLECMVRLTDPIAVWVRTEAARLGIARAALITNIVRDAMLTQKRQEVG